LDTLSIKEPSIEAFLAHKEVPEPLNRYEMMFIRLDSNKKIESSIYLNIIGKNWSSLSVSGLNQAWVLGKFSKLMTL
jgi:hypothetical protein